MTPSFPERLSQRIAAIDSRICLGIDPRPKAHPHTHPERFGGDPAKTAGAVASYFRAIIEYTHELVACYKLQSAFFEALGLPGLDAMSRLIADIHSLEVPIILDAKRGDIGSTARAYAAAYLGEGAFASDALTVNPFLGLDSLEPFLEAAIHNRRGIFVLVHTSNPGSRDYQDARLQGGRTLAQKIAEDLAGLAVRHLDESHLSPLGGGGGATQPDTLARVRTLLPHSFLLVPGYGAQGGAAESVRGAFGKHDAPAIISASRSLTYLGGGHDFALRSRQATLAMRSAVNRVASTRH